MDIQEIKAYMKQQKITYQTLSERSGIALNTLKNIFRGRTEHPRIDTMQAIENALGLNNEKSLPLELTEGEEALLNLFRTASEEQQEMVLQLLRLALAQK